MNGVPVRQIRFYAYGGPEVLRLEDAPVPNAGPGELLLRAEAIGVTLPSVRRVRGEGGRVPLPGVLGGEVAGEIVALGPDVAGFRPGDRVTGLSFTGSYAELACVPAALASRIPDGASAALAVALVRSGHVALAALAAARPAATDSVLITGAASGVGHLAVQLARIRGAQCVVGAVSTAVKADFLRDLGADEVVTYDAEDWGGGVDVVLDGVGGDLLPRGLSALVPGGRMVFFGSGGGIVPAFELLAGAKTITGLSMAWFARTQPEIYRRQGDELWHLARTGRLRPVVHAEIPLADAARAHAIIEARANLGKVVLRP